MHPHTHVLTDVHRNACVNTYLPHPRNTFQQSPKDTPEEPSSPGPLVCDSDTAVLQGHRSPLLGLHDEGVRVYQAKSIEVAN